MPFSFIPCAGAGSDPKPGPIPTRVRALEERIDREITFPRLLGYRYDLPEARLEVKFTADSRLTLSAADLPTKTENAPIIGESVVHDLQELRNRREQEVAFQIRRLAQGGSELDSRHAAKSSWAIGSRRAASGESSANDWIDPSSP